MDIYFSHARTALKYGLLALEFEREDELLVPAFICDVVIHPLDVLGVVPKYYPVFPSLQPDWNALSTMVTRKTRGMMIVHYFGQPQDLEQSRKFCQENGIKLIEDNAHGYGGTYGGRLLGSFGNIGISSPRKSFGWRNGGILHLNTEVAPPLEKLPVQPGSLRWKSRRILKKVLYPVLKVRNRLKKMPDYTSEEIGRESPIPSWAMDSECVRMIERRKMELDTLIARRRAIWEIWQHWARRIHLSPIFDELSPGANPLVFPIRTQSIEESRRWFRWGWERRINVHSWPTLPREIVENDSYTLNLWKTMVCFSIEVEMETETLKANLENQKGLKRI